MVGVHHGDTSYAQLNWALSTAWQRSGQPHNMAEIGRVEQQAACRADCAHLVVGRVVAVSTVWHGLDLYLLKHVG